jgi:biopolymer transport protein ExbB
VELLKAYLDISIFSILGLMSVLMIAFAVERYLFYRQVDLSKYSNLHELDIDLTSHLTVLSTIGANAPYVGLLGTVLGILITFYDLGHSANLDAQTIMVGLALALKATALGLAVAIPAIILYTSLLRIADVKKARWEAMNS